MTTTVFGSLTFADNNDDDEEEEDGDCAVAVDTVVVVIVVNHCWKQRLVLQKPKLPHRTTRLLVSSSWWFL